MEKIKFPEPKQDYKVLCHCITYNQAKYITDTMNGFCMQKTDFPFVCYIIDDASTDGEQDVIKSYLNDYFDIETAEIIDIETANVIIAKHKTNESCTFAVYLLKRNLWKNYALKVKHEEPWRRHCKYIAFCEGDDYWIDPCKLQKQVDALETNPKAMMCYSLSKYVNSNGDPIKSEWMDGLLRRSHGGDIFKDLLLGHFIMTATTVIRKEVLESRILKEAPCSLDYLNSLASAALGETEFIPEEMSCYRANPNGAMSTYIDKVQKSCDLLLKYFIEEYAKGNIKKHPKSYDREIKKTIGEVVYRRAFYQLKDFSFLKSLLIINKTYLLYVFWAFIKIKKENFIFRLTHL